MSINIGQAVTLLDFLRRLDGDNKVEVMIAELMNQINQVLLDMLWVEGNLPTGHKTTVRTGLPNVAWRVLNYGVQPSKSTTTQIVDTCGMLEAFSQIDCKLADLNGNSPLYRLTEDVAFLEAMNQEFVKTLFYGDQSVNPEKFTGLSIRYSSSTAPNGNNIIKGGGTGNTNTSIWLICWGDRFTHGIFPKGTKAGFIHEDLGRQHVYDPNMGKYMAYVTRYEWNVGLTVRDWRQNVRICNIDVTQLTKDASSGAALLDLMAQAYFKLYNPEWGKLAWYANQTIRSFLTRQAYNKTNAHLTVEDVQAAEPVLKFMGIPVRRCDALLNTEAAVA